MITTEGDGVWVELHEVIAAHHEDVFACLTTAGGLCRWLAVSAEIELRTGGVVVLGWDAKATRRTTVAILAYDAGGTMTWDWEVGTQATHAPLYWRVEPSTEEGARVTLRQGPFATDADTLIGMAQEIEFWRWHLSNLRSTLEGSLDMRRVRPL